MHIWYLWSGCLGWSVRDISRQNKLDTESIDWATLCSMLDGGGSWLSWILTNSVIPKTEWEYRGDTPRLSPRPLLPPCHRPSSCVPNLPLNKLLILSGSSEMTKVKIPPQDRIYDVDGYWLRAACVCVKDHSETEVIKILQIILSNISMLFNVFLKHKE